MRSEHSQLDVQHFVGVWLQLVRHAEGEPGSRGLQYAIEIVSVDFDELAVLDFWQGFARLPRQIGEKTDNKR